MELYLIVNIALDFIKDHRYFNLEISPFINIPIIITVSMHRISKDTLCDEQDTYTAKSYRNEKLIPPQPHYLFL